MDTLLHECLTLLSLLANGWESQEDGPCIIASQYTSCQFPRTTWELELELEIPNPVIFSGHSMLLPVADSLVIQNRIHFSMSKRLFWVLGMLAVTRHCPCSQKTWEETFKVKPSAFRKWSFTSLSTSVACSFYKRVKRIVSWQFLIARQYRWKILSSERWRDT